MATDGPVSAVKMTAELRALVEERARACGFALWGVAAVPEAGSAEDELERARFAEWIGAGRAGEMEYLARKDEAGKLLRSSLRVALPWAESVIVCAMDYGGGVRSIDEASKGAGWIAKYAWSGSAADAAQRQSAGEQNGEADPPSKSGQSVEATLRPTDYHEVMLAKLREVEAALRGSCGEGVETRSYVDTGPVVERTYARYAGVGWTGKNTCTLNEERGSWLLMGVIATSLKIEGAVASLANDRCGSCTRCIDACPTAALTGPREMDASRCIAYLTIEKKGSIAEELRGLMGRQVFGCDICQDVCPWNGKQRTANVAMTEMQQRAELVNPALEWLAGLDSAGFKRLFKGSPVERTRLKGLRRNVAIAMGNSSDAAHLPKLQEWAQGEDAVLRETAEWAMRRIGLASEKA